MIINKSNNTNFDGRLRYIAALPGTIEELPFFEIDAARVSKELLDFSQKSAFLNKMKEDKDVFISHCRDLSSPSKSIANEGLFSKLFSATNQKTNTESPRIGNDHVRVMFQTNNPAKKEDTEFCVLHVTLPVNKGTPNNLDRFEKIMENNSDFDAMKVAANHLFPNDKHKVVPLPKSDFGYCEFWTGKRSSFDTLNKLYLISKAQVKNIYNKINENIINKCFG